LSIVTLLDDYVKHGRPASHYYLVAILLPGASQQSMQRGPAERTSGGIVDQQALLMPFAGSAARSKTGTVVRPRLTIGVG
jgi:hypothetical protein